MGKESGVSISAENNNGVITGFLFIIRFLTRTLAIYLLSALVIVCIVYIPEIKFSYDNTGPAQQIEVQIGWTQSLDQVTHFFRQVFIEGNFGRTASDRPIENEIKRVLPRSGKVIFTSFLLIMIIGVLKGVFDFRNRHSRLSVLGDRFTSIIQSFPDFYFITAMIWIILYFMAPLDFMLFASEKWYGFILPTLIVSLYPISYVAKITYNALLEESSKHYVQVSFSKGLTEKFVVYQHLLVNCFSTILSHLTSVMLLLLSNLFILELFLDYKGMALRLYSAIPLEREVIIAIAWIFMTIVFFIQILSFFLRYYIDPTIRRV